MENLTRQIRPTFEEMVSAIASFSDKEFNEIPFEGSWTPGQVAQHVRLSVKGMPELLQGTTKNADREPDEKVKMAADIFLDFDKKMKAPDFIDPEMRHYDKAKMLEFFTDFSSRFQKLASELDLSKICLDFEIPGFGPMTRLEFVAFVVFHAQRHVRQLENIAAEI